MAKKILVVDDSSTIRSQVAFSLGPAGYTVIEAVDGEDGIRKLDANLDVAMVICDVNMPRMSGLEMLEKLKGNGRALPPVVMLTTEGSVDLITKAKALGAKGWMVKPFKPDMLIGAVRKIAGA